MAKLFSRKDGSSASDNKVDTIIGPDSVFQGILFLKNTVCVEGSFKGKIESKSAVIVGKNGVVEADILADHVIVNGEVSGSICAYAQLDIGESGRVRGDVESRVVTIEKGGLLQGFCHMLSGSEDAENSVAVPVHRRIQETSSNEEEHYLDHVILPKGREDEKEDE